MKKKIILLCLLFVAFIYFVGCQNSSTPYIGDNGNWWIEGTDTGVKAQGEKGEKGATGATGEQGAKGPQGESGEKGEDGVSVVSIKKTGTKDNVDTYTITYSNGKTSTFTVTNGLNGTAAAKGDQGIQGEKGDDGHTPVITIGLNGNWYVDGVDTKQPSALKGDAGNGIQNVKLTSSNGLVDTYTITYTNGTISTFTVKNGQDGSGSTYIGDNGCLWVDGVDTGFVVDSSKEDKREVTTKQKIMQTGLRYQLITINGNTGYFVTGFDDNAIDDDYGYYKFSNLLTYTEYQTFVENYWNGIEKFELIIPNYIGSIPVIGIYDEAFENLDKLYYVSLSKNTLYLGDEAFQNCTSLKEVDFNNCELLSVGISCFKGDSNFTIADFPSTITYVGDYAFYNCKISNFDFNTVTYIGSYAFKGLRNNVYLPSTVEYVGSNAFGSGYLFLEHSEIPSTWGSNINGNDELFGRPILNCVNNGEYIYSLKNNEITLHEYLGSGKKLVIPEYIDDKPVKAIGYGFNSTVFENWEDILEKEIENNATGYLEEIYIPSYIERVEYGSLLTPISFIYIEEGVEEVWGLIGCLADDEFKVGCVIYENPSNITFKIQDHTYDYDTYIGLDDELSYRIFSNLDYSKIYYDETTKTYYYNEGTSYSVLASFDFFADEIIVPDTINNMPVKQIGKYAYGFTYACKITIGSNVRKIKTEAFGYVDVDYDVYIFIPNTVEIINSNAFIYDDDVTYYLEASQKPDDWDTNWNSGNSNVKYSYSLSAFNSIGKYHGMSYMIVNNEVVLVEYDYSNTYVKIPRMISGKPVTTILTDFFCNRGSWYFYIPSTVTNIGSQAFENTRYSTFYFYFEAQTKSSNIASDYYYNSYYGDNSSYKCEYFGQNLDY